MNFISILNKCIATMNKTIPLIWQFNTFVCQNTQIWHSTCAKIPIFGTTREPMSGGGSMAHHYNKSMWVFIGYNNNNYNYIKYFMEVIE